MEQLAARTWVRNCTGVYVLLVVLTLITYMIGQQSLVGVWPSITVLVLALLKGHMIGRYFMGLGRLGGLWRWPVMIWLILLGLSIAAAFFFAA